MSENNNFIDITIDGGVKKKILLEGKGEMPIKGDIVKIKYKEFIEQNLNKELLQKKYITTNFTLGNNRMHRGLEIGIKTMKVGEKSELIISKEYTNDFCRDIKLKDNNKINYEIELLECQKNQKEKNIKKPIDIFLMKNDIKTNLKININDNIKKTKSKDYINLNAIKQINEGLKIEKMSIEYEIKNQNELRLETYSPICDKCFRLIYISFDFIDDFILTKCSYCNRFDVYKYTAFIKKLNKMNNPLLNIHCQKCSKKLNVHYKNFYLIEKPDYIFSVACDKCAEEKEFQSYIKKIIISELIRHYFYIYEKIYMYEINNNLDKIKQLEQNFLKEKKNILNNLIILKDYEEKLNLIELINQNSLNPLRAKAEKKISKLKNELNIKKILVEYFHQYNNFIIGKNICSLLATIPDFNNLNLSKNKKYNLKETNEIIESFLIQDKYIYFNNIKDENKFFNEFIITKTCLDKNIMLENKNETKFEIFKPSYLNIININLENGESIVYNILGDYFSAEKITPIQFNYNKISNLINEQEVLIYNIKEDNCLYYGIYDINSKRIKEDSLIKLIQEPITEFKCIFLNYGQDILVIEKTPIGILYDIFYLSDFRNQIITEKYNFDSESFDLEIINNEISVCIKAEKKLFMVSRNLIKEIKLNHHLIEYLFFEAEFLIDSNGKVYENPAFYLYDNMNNNFNKIKAYNNKHNMNNYNTMNNLNNFNNMNNMNNFNNMNNNFNNMNNMNNMNNTNNFNNMNNMNNFNNMNNMNNMNNFNNMNNMNNMNNFNNE